MSSLQERLLRMKSQRGAPAQPSDSTEESEERGEWTDIGAGERRLDGGGTFVERVVRYPLSERVGRVDLRDLADGVGWLPLFANAGAESIAAIGGLRAEEVVFFDTETTGLGVGTGNVPFMLGAGSYEEGHFTVRQWFIRGPAEEAAMLRHFGQWLSRFKVLVTFNGKSFDWPVMATRFVMNRLEAPAAGLLHADLLYPSRRLWKNVLPSCRLATVERDILGIDRGGDVPGSQAPTLYFQYLNDRRPETIAPVFRHNDRDIVGLAALAALLAGMVDGRRPAEELSAEEHVRLALWCEQLDAGRAERLWQSLLERPIAEAQRYWPLAAARAKKAGRPELAARLWQDWIAAQRHRPVLPVEPFIQLAMYYEHVRKDYNQAYRYAEQALDMALKRRGLSRVGEKARLELEEIRHRMRRLERKADPPDAERQQSLSLDV